MSCAQAVCVMEGGTHGAGTASKVWLHHSLESVHAQHCLMQASRVRWAGFEAVGTELGGKQPCSLLRTKLQSQTDFVDVWQVGFPGLCCVPLWMRPCAMSSTHAGFVKCFLISRIHLVNKYTYLQASVKILLPKFCIISTTEKETCAERNLYYGGLEWSKV